MLRLLLRSLLFVVKGAVFFLALFCVMFAVMQTKWAKEKVRTLIIEQLKAQGIQARIEGLEGRLPLSWTIERIELRLPSDQSLLLLQSKVRLGIVPLFRKHLVINYLSIAEASYTFTPSPTTTTAALTIEEVKQDVRTQLQNLSPALHFSVKSFKVGTLTIENRSTQKSYSFGLHARGHWQSGIGAFSFEGKLSSARSDVYAEIVLNGNRTNGEISAGVRAHIEEVSDLAAFYEFPFTGDLLVEAAVSGPWNTWQALLWDSKPDKPLSGMLKGRVRHFNLPAYPLLNRDWQIRTDISLLPGMPLLINHFQLLSNLLSVKGQAEIVSDLYASNGHVAFAFPDIAAFSPFLSTDLKGKLAGKASYRTGQLQCSFASSSIEIQSFPWEHVCGNIQSSQAQGIWVGNMQLSAEKGILPFQSNLNFAWNPGTDLKLTDIAVKTEDATLNGELTVLAPNALMEGALYAQISEIKHFAPFFSSLDLEGGVGAECILSVQLVDKVPEQNLRLELFGKTTRYAEYTIEQLSFSAEVYDLYDLPTGKINLVADKIITPQFSLSQLNVHTHSEDQRWPFSLTASGSMLDPFEITASGSWEKGGNYFALNFERAEGSIVKKMFYLQHPFSIECSPSQLDVSDCLICFDKGTIQGSVNLTPSHAKAQMHMQHFPLDILSILQPNFILNGSVTASGSFDATLEQMSGSFNAALEEADVLYYGKEVPLKTKGTIQAHLDNYMLQIHSSLKAPGGQFVELAASVPMRYTIDPFKLSIDPSKKLSGELIAEGQLEELFDFINIGSHNITGLISCRLFLSQTFDSPALQGMIDWEKGTYENYYTGTALKDIQATIEAEKNQLKITALTAHDEHGFLSANGRLELKYKEKFPYEICAELNNLNALRFDMIDSHLSGPLYITGNTESAQAQGNLTVPKAAIKIPDQLPYEIPNLPITFINRPAHLRSPQISSLPVFPFHIDLELTAEDQVFVEGKGLKSQWQGSVHLSGTNMTVAANGKLDLINGEYSFAGRIFKLIEGQIIFNDKPTPSAYLKLSGILNLQDVEITANLYGPLTSPQLTFQSNPHMSTSSILSYILFNKNIADINQMEAIQLATTLMDLSGGATPGVMEAIRKTLGIDRLTIVPSSSSSSEKNEIALQIGKYLTKGVLVTLSQSATSTQVIVEVELKKGFVLQAETQEQQEGKFSLKWRRNY